MYAFAIIFCLCVTTVGCIEPPDFATCPNGTRLAEVGGQEGCFLGCEADDDCPGNQTCRRTICLPEDAVSDAGIDSVDDVADMGPDESLVELCELTASKVFDCVLTECDTTPELETAIRSARLTFLEGDDDVLSCVESLSGDAESREVFRQLSNFTCEESSQVRCGGLRLQNFCECAEPTTIGSPCTSEGDCIEEDLYGGCNINVPNGYCVAFDCPDPPDELLGYTTDICGSGNACVRFNEDSSACLKGCTTNADCRPEYGCQLVGAALDASAPTGACTPLCEADSDCLGPCTNGVCEFPCIGEIGEQVCELAGGTCVVGVQETPFCNIR